MSSAPQQARRPTVEQLELVPQIRRYSRDACLAVRECQLNHNYAMKLRALRQKEDDLARRARELDAREKRLNGACPLPTSCVYVCLRGRSL